jgi:hypothetical protein
LQPKVVIGVGSVSIAQGVVRFVLSASHPLPAAMSGTRSLELSTGGSEPDAKLQSILSNYAADKVGIVQTADLLEERLRALGLMYDMEIHSRQVDSSIMVLGHSYSMLRVFRPGDWFGSWVRARCLGPLWKERGASGHVSRFL